ncbi:unnamed protein product [Brassica rapa subsp. trilocularis]
MEEILRPCFHVISVEAVKPVRLIFHILKLNKSDTGKPNLSLLLGQLARYIRTWDIHSAGLFILHRIFCDIFGAAFISPSVDSTSKSTFFV